MSIIEVNNLKKSFGKFEAVKGLNFHVKEGSLFAFLGPNGAGKSTTINIISTLLSPTEGDIKINGYSLGKDDFSIRSSIGIVFQESLLDPLLTVKENLFIRGQFYGLSKSELKMSINKAAKTADILDFIDRPYGKLSGGQRRRADIARALINTPKILFLDEPTTGLDPQTRKNVWETIQKLQRENGMTVFLTTHYMEEAAKADYIVIIDDGIISAQGTPLDLKLKYSSDTLRLKPLDKDKLCTSLNNEKVFFDSIGEILVIPIKSTLDSINIINKIKDNIEGFEVVNGTMDDVFINITGKEIRE